MQQSLRCNHTRYALTYMHNIQIYLKKKNNIIDSKVMKLGKAYCFLKYIVLINIMILTVGMIKEDVH